ncbi:MAG: DUF3836 domain-containing protein [Massilibacteroides sp.]|nr:DUF3836 domain-containing protein [Massilibacteroides sp.]MDD3063234.1 DUF3836 domain-containing protein [Massilibacteroides sp.]MDD4115623.1 DUF3836 domain-containing protein [Massilibacteroides sp.]MDD4661160.1 DUF3836 domain-containing protein [Massilibacteroides sp.]
MKKSVLTKGVLALVVLFVCSLAISASSPRNYIYDTKEENGKIVSKVIFLQEEGLLNKEVKYEFAYNEAGKVTEKKAFRWDKKGESWEPFYLTTYTYNTDNNEIHSVYAMWNKTTKDFSVNVQEMNLPALNYDSIFQ